jgi:hypothetical protein
MKAEEIKQIVNYLSDTDLVDIVNHINGKGLGDHCVNCGLHHLKITGSHSQPSITFYDYVAGYNEGMVRGAEICAEIASRTNHK